MRIAILGGTRFIGAAILEELVAREHDVLVVHRGDTERDDLPDVPHFHLDRLDDAALHEALGSHDAQWVVDTCAYTRADAKALAGALRAGAGAVVLSSQDTYRAFHRLRTGGEPVDALPLDEDSPTREGDERFLFRGEDIPLGVGAAAMDDYENLDVEEVMGRTGATILRLPLTYGERDPMRREGFVLRRVLAGRTRIPFGPGTLLWSKGYVRDVASAVRTVIEADARGATYNVAEARAVAMITWARRILAAAGSDAALVRVPDAPLPPDLELTAALSQHIVVDSTRIRRDLGWTEADPGAALAATVAWHTANPPPPFTDEEAAADDEALAQAL